MKKRGCRWWPMSPKGVPRILPGALFVADAHYNPLGRTELIGFLEAIASGRINPPQLFLMGDIADILMGPLKFTQVRNRLLIERVNRIADRGVEVWFFEGNHDFLLKGVFSDRVNRVAFCDQPAEFEMGSKRAILMHGDFRVARRYQIYSAIIRHPVGLMLIHLLSFNFLNNHLVKRMERHLQAKNICHPIAGFEQKRSNALQDRAKRTDIVIEGHFHQSCQFKIGAATYYNLPAFACGQRYSEVESTDKGLSLSVKEWGA